MYYPVRDINQITRVEKNDKSYVQLLGWCCISQGQSLSLSLSIYIYNQSSEKIQLDFNKIFNFVQSELLSVKVEESKFN